MGIMQELIEAMHSSERSKSLDIWSHVALNLTRLICLTVNAFYALQDFCITEFQKLYRNKSELTASIKLSMNSAKSKRTRGKKEIP